MKMMKHFSLTLVLIALAIAARAALSESFEQMDDESYVSDTNAHGFSANWLGMGHVETLAKEEPMSSPAGYPLAQESHDKVLTTIGSVTVENNLPDEKSDFAQVDYLQEVCETVDTFTTDEIEDVQIALATGKRLTDDPTHVDLWLYCLPKGQTKTAWVKIGNVELGTWMRVNLAFDYRHQTCRVSVNGIPRMSENGYLLPDAENSADGSWYRIATADRREHVTTVQFVGLNTQFEDVVISEQPFESYEPFVGIEKHGDVQLADETWTTVSLNDLNRWGINNEVDIAKIHLDKSGLSVKDKLEVGYDPLDNKKFAAIAMHMEKGEDNRERVMLAIPKGKEADDLAYRIIAKGTYDNGKAFHEVLATTKKNVLESTEVMGELPADAPRVLTFHLEAARQTKMAMPR